MRLSSDGTFRVKGAGTAGSTDAVQFSGSAPASTLILNSSGNLGLGVTPSAWGGAKAFEAGLVGNYFIGSTAASYTSIGTASYYNGSNWVYARSTAASKYELLNNTHAWYTAPSGTAGNAISFTQAMTLDADGRLALGATGILGTSNRASFTNTTSAKGVLALQNTSVSGYSAIELYDNGGTQQGAMGWGNASVAVTGAASATYLYSTGPITFLSGGTTERARITSGGDLLVGTTSQYGSQKLSVNGGIAIDGRSAVTPGLSEKSDDDTGVFWPTANTLGFSTGGTERARITATGSFVAGAQAALATTATDGFLYVPTCAGTPTGVPTTITGMAPIVVNTTNNKLYFYSGGAWRDAGP
jgi:hypothetical protein